MTNDYISREAAIAVIEEKQKELCPVGMYSRHAVYGLDREKFDAWQEIIDTLERIPVADVRPVVRGKWVEKKHATMHPEDYFCRMALSCSICGHEIDYGRGYGPNYCGNCGADMREEESNERTD